MEWLLHKVFVSADLRNYTKDIQMAGIYIADDFDLEKIALSGQCFRVRKFADETYRFIKGDRVLYIKQLNNDEYQVSCGQTEWHEVWEDYFDLSRSYAGICQRAGGDSGFISRAAAYSRGIRVLHQDPWEMLITFIISQRKNIPAITKSVEALSKKYGRPIETDYETVSAFPTPQELYAASDQDLSECSLGYRIPYVQDAVSKVVSGVVDLDGMRRLDDDSLFQELLKIHGVGKKVANCVRLFGYGRTGSVPVDVWIARAISEEYAGCDPFPAFGDEAGIVQQYVFYYIRSVYRT